MSIIIVRVPYTIEFLINENQFISAVVEKCAAVKIDYDPTIDDDLEKFFFEECSRQCPMTESATNKQLTTVGIPCIRKFTHTGTSYKYFSV